MDCSQIKTASKKIFARHWLWAVLLCAIVFWIDFAAGAHTYYLNDDMEITLILSGFYGEPSAYTVFNNYILSWLLKTLFTFSQPVNWFYLFIQAVCFAANVVIVHLFLSRGRAAGWFFAFGYAALIYRYALSCMTFTIAGYFAAIAGALLLADRLLRGDLAEKTSAKCLRGGIFWGKALIVTAYCIRTNLLPQILIYLFTLGLMAAASDFSKKGRRALRSFALSAGSAVCCICLLMLINLIAYQVSPGWGEFLDYSSVRAAAQDYPLEYADEASEHQALARAGMSKNDLAMLRSFFYADSGIVNAASLRGLVEDAKGANPSEQLAHAVDTLVSRILPGRAEKTGSEFVGIGLALSLVASLLFLPAWRRSLEPLIAAGAALFTLLTFCYIDRLVERTIFPTAAFLIAVSLLAMLGVQNTRAKRIALAVVSAVVLAGSVSMTRSMHIASFGRLPIMSDLSSGTESIYVIAPHYFGADDTSPWAVPIDAPNLIAVGGWSTFSPNYALKLDRMGLNNPFTALLERQNAYLIGDDSDRQMLKTYLSERFDVQTDAVLLRYERGYGVYKFFVVA